MGVNYDEDDVKRKRRELRERLIAQQEKDRQHGSQNNGYGDGYNGAGVHGNRQVGNTYSSGNESPDTMSNSQTSQEKAWQLVKTILYAYGGAALSIGLLSSWFSPLYADGNILYYLVLVLILIKGIGTYVCWLYLKANNQNSFFKPSETKFKIYALIWIVLFLIMLFGSSISFNNTMGVFCCIICVVFAYYKSYQASKFINRNF